MMNIHGHLSLIPGSRSFSDAPQSEKHAYRNAYEKSWSHSHKLACLEALGGHQVPALLLAVGYRNAWVA